MVKWAIGASWMFPGASGMGVSEAVAVEAWGVALSLPRFRDFDPLCEDEVGEEEDGNVVGVN